MRLRVSKDNINQAADIENKGKRRKNMKNGKLWAKKILVFLLLTTMTVNVVDTSALAAAVEVPVQEETQENPEEPQREENAEDLQQEEEMEAPAEEAETEAPQQGEEAENPEIEQENIPQEENLQEENPVQILSSNDEVINIAEAEATGSNGQIIINADNLNRWDNKILTGSVISADLDDSAKGIVVDGVELHLTIRNLTIDRKNFGNNSISAIALTNQAILYLTLEGDNSLYGAYGGAGIDVPSGTVLSITGESSGSLYAKGGNMYGGGAGIGAISPGLDLNYSTNPQTRSCGYIKIAGGTVKAEGGTYRFRGSEISGGAGIGGSYGVSGGIIQITGGAVTAIGGMYGAGIGGGGNGSVARITIDGGTVIAEGTGKGAKQPAAIGRGIDMDTTGEHVLPCGEIKLNGGSVTAKGNIGYGYVYFNYYPSGDNAKVTVSDQVFLAMDGEINDGSRSNVKNYSLSFTVFDTAFTDDRTATVTLEDSLIQETIAAKMTMPGQVAFTLSFAHNAFSGEKTFTVTIDGKTYEATANFKESQTEYDLTAGRALYPVSLEFYDDAITGNVAVDEISVKQNGTALDSTEFVHPGNIEPVINGIGKMMIFLPANENTTEITVKASGINGSEAMTKIGLTIGTAGITTVSMCNGRVTLSAKISRVNATDVKIAVASNVMTWDLYMKQSNDQVIDDPQVIISEGTQYAQTAQKGEAHLESLKANHNYGYYLVAKQGDLVSEIVEIHFNTPNGARVFWENNSSAEKYYAGFFDAVSNATNISPDGFTIQAQGSANWGSELTLRKSCTLDLNGQNVSINGTSQYSLALAEDVLAVLTDSAGDAEYHNANGNSTLSLFNMESNSSLTIQGGGYYDYKELLKRQSETQTGRTLTIEGGSFHGGNHIDIGDGKVVLSGGTFYGGLSVNGGYEIKDGYSVKYLTGSNQGTYTTTLPERGDDIEIVPLPELRGSLDLTIGDGVSSSARPSTKITATFTDKDEDDGIYIYKWYCVDGDKETVVRTSVETRSKTSTYMLLQENIGKQFYCEVTKKGTSGSIKSEKTYPVIGESIDGAVIELQQGIWRYDGTEQKPEIKSVTLNNGVTTLTRDVSYRVSYENNIHAGTAKVIITGIGIYDGTAETTFTIGQKTDYADLKIEGVESAYEYTGEEICPKIVVKDGNQVIPESQYTVAYKDNVKPGTAVITITGTEDGDYYFGANNNYKYFTIFHDHDWNYKASGSTILMECKKDACPLPDRRATLMLRVDDADTLKYNGITQDVATISQNPDGSYPDSKIRKEYIGDGLENGLPENAGSYTATMSIEEGGVTYTATFAFEIQKADTQIGTVTADTLENTLDVDQVQLSRTDTTIPGILKLKEGTILQYGTHDYDWVFEPDDSVNYETLDGTVSITIKDTIAPSASWKIGESGFRKFVNTISFGFLCKNTETMEIMYEDAESGVATKQYYIADWEITDFSGVEWTDYTAPIVLPTGPIRIVYVRVTDQAGNQSILNSDGLTVYQESVLESDEISYTYKEGQVRELYVKLNGNIFAEMVDDRNQDPGRNLNYSFDEPEGRLTLSGNYLDSLSVGTHTYKIKLYPQGRQEVETIVYRFSVTVEKAKLYVVDARAAGRTYDGSRLVNVTGITLGRVDGYRYEPGPSVDIHNLSGTLDSADAGTHQNVTLPTLTLTGEDVESYELVQPEAPVGLLPTVTISKKAAPVIQTIDKSYVYAKDIAEMIDLTEFLPADCGKVVLGQPNHGTAVYEYYKAAPTVNGSILSYTAGKTTWEQMQNAKSGELVVPVQMTNYEDTEVRFTLRLRDQTNVILKQGMEVRLKNNVLTYGQPLSTLLFEAAVFTDEAGNVIEGTLGWQDGSLVPNVGTATVIWQFTPADAEYKPVSGEAAIVIKPAPPRIETPAGGEERSDDDPAETPENSEATDGGSSSAKVPAGTAVIPVPAAGKKPQSQLPAPEPEPTLAPASTPVLSDSNEPFIKGEDGKEGWKVITAQTEEAAEGEKIHVDMNGSTAVPGEIFDSIQGRDITVTFDLGGGILWTVNGLDVTAQNIEDIDFGITMGEQAGGSIPVDVINNVTGERYSMNLTLAYEGEFGFKATLTINMDAANAGLYANLFYYNPAREELEFMSAGRIDEAGNTELAFSHASDYTIVIDSQPMDGTVEATNDISDNSSHNRYLWILLGAGAVVLAALGAGYMLYRKRENS